MLFLFGGGLERVHALPDLVTFSFSKVEVKTLQGSSDSCSGKEIASVDIIGNLALVARPHSDGNCYNRAQYAHANFLTKRGVLTSSAGATYPAYEIHEPQHKATSFLASPHAVYYKFPTREDYSIYRFDAGILEKVATVLAADITLGDYVPVPGATPLLVSGIQNQTTYVFAPSRAKLSAFTELAPDVEGARIGTTPFGDILKYRYKVSHTPYDTTADYTAAPKENMYSDKRRYFLVKNQTGELGAVWQDQVDLSIQLTWFGDGLVSPTTIQLKNKGKKGLAAAAGDGMGTIYYLTIETGENSDKTIPISAMLNKADADGSRIKSVDLDTSGSGFNLYSFSRAINGASLKYQNGKLAMILGRKMLQGRDGLNHQGAIGVVFNSTTLAIERNWGQTSGHSIESFLTANDEGEFLGIDLGDNYPRGIHLHKFSATSKHSRVVSSFKTRHGTSSKSPANAIYPRYAEISDSETTFYKWSNDNRTYTELGGVAQTSLGYTVSFIGEPTRKGLLLDNSRTKSGVNDARNIGLLTVAENFESFSTLADMMKTKGASETGGFYTFGGSWTSQNNAGVVWLTDYTDASKNASRLKMIPRPDGNLFLMWELWNTSQYLGTKAMVVSPKGKVVVRERDISSFVRLGRRDDLYLHNQAICLLSGNKSESVIELVVIGAATASASLLDTWRAERFTAQTLASPALEATMWGHRADPDGDGNANLLEYAMGTNPRKADDFSHKGVLGIRTIDGRDQFSYTIRQRLVGADSKLNYIIEISDELKRWDPLNVAPTFSDELSGDWQGFVEATYLDTQAVGSQAKQFFRVRVTYD